MQSENGDEGGFIPEAGRIDSNSPLALLSTFPIDEAFLYLKKKKFSVEISFSAGTFVCNDLYFRTLQKTTYIQSVFVHVPLLPEQIKVGDLRPSMKFEEQFETLKSLLLFLIEK